ncbi:MAG: hypothetical protein GF329_18280 [Candidatus Lokiarchaeota archaeon]|nr:hypothetical protein [Candidatus Lokiarchaeota archaeon]
MKGTIIKEAIALVTTIIFIVILTLSFGIIPALGNFLNPFGIWTVPGNSEYPSTMTIRDSRLTSDVHVNIDTNGIPHIYAETDEDLYFALGYLHGYNRLFEADMFRRYASGMLSEILGEDLLSTDIYMRTLGFYRRAKEEIDFLKVNATPYYDLLQSYCNGMNVYIDSIVPNNLPLEYYILSITPESWKPFDVIVSKYLQSWGLTSIKNDLDFTLLKEKLPDDVFNELYPNWTIGLPFEDPIIPEISASSEADVENTLTRTIKGILNFMDSIPNILGDVENYVGSNNWVVNGSKTKTGNPLLAGDPHLQHQMPSLWYEVHMISNEVENGMRYNTTGVTFPGIPLIIIGHNDHIAWSLTNVGGDGAVDFYDETINSNGTQYYYNNTWHPINVHTPKIDIKGGSSVIITVRETIHGPIISDILSDEYFNEYPKSNLSLKWSGLHTPLDGTYNVVEAVYGINRASNWTQFNESLALWDSPPQNFVYADDQGNIAMTVAGAHPVRKQGVSGTPDPMLTGKLVQPGNGTGEEWAGFIPYGKVPQALNPDQCYLASANQRSINASYPYYMGSNSWASGYRAREINRILRSRDNFTLDDFKNLQADNYDYSASQFVPILIDVWNYSINSGDTYSSDVMQAMNELYKWNQSDQKFIMNRSLIAPTIYWRWIDIYESNTWGDEFSNWSANGLKLPDIKILENLTKYVPDSIWFNDTAIADTQTRNYTMLKTLNDTVDWYKTNYDPDVSNWEWGDVHKIYFEHLTALDPLNRGPYSHDGSSWTPNNAGGGWDSEEKAYIVQAGPSWRMVIDLGNVTTELESVGVYPGGQSGNPLSSHYDDLLQLWLNYEYHDIYFLDQDGVTEATILFTR